MEMIEERKIVPIAAVISAGKSKILNLILNIKFLESKTDIGTKFVNILRYNPNIEQPQFYHLKIINEKGKYLFYKDPDYEPIIGEESIIEENKKINKMNKINQVEYDDIFYMTEINSIGFLKDEQYMLTHDLCDIPGLSEYQEKISIKKEDINKKELDKKLEENLKKGQEFDLVYKPNNLNNKEFNSSIRSTKDDEDDIFYDLDIENESTYITEIYKRIKDKIDGAIIVLSVENYYLEINIEIIAKLHKVIEKKIENFLIIFNKIDLSSNPTSDIESCNGFLFNAFPKCQTFNLNMNTFIPMSAIQVQNELLMNESFRHLLLYYFYNYKQLIKQDKSNKISNKTYIDYLRDNLKIVSDITRNEIEYKVEELNNKNNISKINEKIKSIIIDLETLVSEELDLNLGIKESDIDEEEDEDEDYLTSLSSHRSSSTKSDSLNDIEPISIIKIYYILHKEKKLILKYSYETDKLINYFTVKDEKNQDKKNDEEDKIVSKIDLNKQIINELEVFYKEFESSDSDLEQIKYLSIEIQKLIEFLNIYDVIFIPLFGPSNAGKSTIINGIIGRDLLPTDLNECTKRGIIIKYSDEENVIKKADFVEEDFSNQKYYFLDASNYIIGQGDEQIIRTLKGLNYKFNDKQEDSFYYIKTKIKLFDELGLDKSLKNMIYLIDLPGYGTKNFFKSDICKKVISICNCFFFVSRNSVIKNKETKSMLDSFILTKDSKQNFTSKLIKSSLFIFNNDINQSSSLENLNSGKNDIKSLIKGIEEDDINLCFYNAKQYINFCRTYNYFYDLENTLNKEYNSYNDYHSYSKLSEINNNFPKYMFDLVLQKAKQFTCKMKKKQKMDKKTEDTINEFFENIGQYKNENKIDMIKVLSFCRENINKTNYYEESNIEEFKKNLNSQIKYVNDNKQQELRESIDNVLSILDMFFGKNFEENKKDIKEINNFTNKMDELKIETKSLINSNIEENIKILKSFKANTLLALYEKKKNLEILLNDRNYEKIVKEINIELEKSIKELIESIKKFIESHDKKCTELFNEIKIAINNFHKIKIESLTKYNFKAYLSNALGDGKKDLCDEIMEEIKSRCESLSGIFQKKGFKEWFISFFSSFSYMQNVIDMVVETYSSKIEQFLKMIENKSVKYLEIIINKINHYINASKIDFNENQKEKWEKLCNLYEKTKAKILEIEKNNII